MKIAFLAIFCLLIGHIEARQIFKTYIEMVGLNFRDGHFRTYKKGKLLKLKVIRANNAGIYYLPRDVCKAKYLHNSHDKNKKHGKMGDLIATK